MQVLVFVRSWNIVYSSISFVSLAMLWLTYYATNGDPSSQAYGGYFTEIFGSTLFILQALFVIVTFSLPFIAHRTIRDIFIDPQFYSIK